MSSPGPDLPPPNVRPSARPGEVEQSATEEPVGTGGAAFFVALFALLHTFLLVVSLAALMIFGTRCEKVFREFNMKLPDSTLFVLAVVRWLSNYWYVLVPFLLVGFLVDGAIVYLLHRTHGTRRWSYVWAAAVVILIVLFAGCGGATLYVPYNTLLEGLSR